MMMANRRRCLVMTTRETREKVQPLIDILEQARWNVEAISHLPSAHELRDRQTFLIISHHNGVLLRQEQIDAVNGRVFNLHPSVLPLNRGSSPIMWATISSTIYGVTLHQVNTGIDKGRPVSQQVLEIDENQNLAQIYSAHELVWYEMFTQLTKGEAWCESPDDLFIEPLVIGEGTYNSRQRSHLAFETFEKGWNTAARVAREQYHSRFGL